jgi:hypothetical protein
MPLNSIPSLTHGRNWKSAVPSRAVSDFCPDYDIRRSGFLRRTLPHRPPVSLDVLSCFDGLGWSSRKYSTSRPNDRLD